MSPGCLAIWQLTLRPNRKAKVMTLDISFQPMRVLIDGHDSEGNLVLADKDTRTNKEGLRTA